MHNAIIKWHHKGKIMKAITVRGVDNQLEKKLKGAAREESVSVNQFILKSLRQVLGLEKDRIHTKEFNDLDFIFGVWSEEEFELFEKSQKDFGIIESGLWK